jgi:hypothetical protein
MANWRNATISLFLADGVKNLGERIKALRRELLADDKITLDEIRFMSDLRVQVNKRAKSRKEAVDPAFDTFFFKQLHEAIMDDDKITAKEAGVLREVLFADGRIDPAEKAFLQKLKKAAKEKAAPEFEKLYDECMASRR